MLENKTELRVGEESKLPRYVPSSMTAVKNGQKRRNIDSQNHLLKPNAQNIHPSSCIVLFNFHNTFANGNTKAEFSLPVCSKEKLFLFNLSPLQNLIFKKKNQTSQLIKLLMTRVK